VRSGGCAIAAPSAYQLPGAGTWYVRLYADGANRSYSFTFGLFSYSPNKPTCLDITTTCVVTDNAVVSGATAGLNFTYEPAHFYKIRLLENQTIWVNASSTQIDIVARLWNQPSDASPPLQKGFSSHAFTTGEDVETFSYRMTAAELANTTGWYFVEVKINSDLPPEGLYTLRVWLNDRPVALNRTLSNPLNTDEDVEVAQFDLYSLFYDNDCKLGDTPDCALRITETGPAPADITFSFDGGHLVNVTSTANWSGSGCRNFTAFDARNLSAQATLCAVVAAVNDAPYVVTTIVQRSMQEDQPLLAVLVASWFADADGDALSLSADGNTDIDVTIDPGTGLADFDPHLDFNGANNITFTACDTNSSCVDWTVEFSVGPANDAPSARGTLPFLSCDEDGATTLNLDSVLILSVLGPAFTDIDGDSLSYRLANIPADLEVTVLGPVITVRPKPDVAGIYFFEVKAFDGLAESFPASVRVTVAPVNDAPLITVRVPTANPSVQEGSSRDFSVTASDVDGDTLHYQWYVDGTGQTNALFATFNYAAEQTN
jgi:hypothetical protein